MLKISKTRTSELTSKGNIRIQVSGGSRYGGRHSYRYVTF